MSKGLDYDTLNENVKKTAYAVRGELYLRASELQKQGKKVCCNSIPDTYEFISSDWINLSSKIIKEMVVTIC